MQAGRDGFHSPPFGAVPPPPSDFQQRISGNLGRLIAQLVMASRLLGVALLLVLAAAPCNAFAVAGGARAVRRAAVAQQALSMKLVRQVSATPDVLFGGRPISCGLPGNFTELLCMDASQVNTQEFEEAIQDCSTPIVVDIYAVWCGPVRAGTDLERKTCFRLYYSAFAKFCACDLRPRQ